MSHAVEVGLPVLWGDMDALGHVNNVRYFQWFEQARIALFEAVGLVHTGTPTVGPILATTRCDFEQPLAYPDHVLVRARVERIGRTSFVLAYEVVRAADPAVPVASGDSVVVMFDYEAQTSVAMPEDLRAALEAHRA